jgi:hypothetical protein
MIMNEATVTGIVVERLIGPYTPSNPTQSDLLNVGRKLQIV